MTNHSLSDLFYKLKDDQQPLDLTLLCAFFGCLALGLVMVASASASIASADYGNPFHFVMRQGIFMLIGVSAFFGCMSVPTNVWMEQRFLVLATSVLLLILVLFLGREVNGSTRWLPIGSVNIQPSEVAKVGMVIYTASFLTMRLEQIRTRLYGAAPLIFMLTAVGLLLLLEPDFGSTVVIAGAGLGMIFLAGVRKLPFILLLTTVGSVGGLLIWKTPYRFSRVTAFLDPWADQFGSGYQLTQSLIGFGRGGITGEGLGDSIQKLFFLPEAHTDFIFSVIAEELGFIGAVLIIGLLFFITWRALDIGRQAEKAGLLFPAYMAYGLGILFGSQVFINVGVSSGLLPTKGLALPLFSYGGSSLVMNCVAIGLLMRIDFERRTQGVMRAVTAKSKSRTATRKADHG